MYLKLTVYDINALRAMPIRTFTLHKLSIFRTLNLTYCARACRKDNTQEAENIPVRYLSLVNISDYPHYGRFLVSRFLWGLFLENKLQLLCGIIAYAVGRILPL